MSSNIFKYILFCGFIAKVLFVYAQEKTTIEPVNFNSSEREYAPVYFNKGLVYCSNNIKNEALTYVDKETGKQLTDMYFVTKDSVGFGEPKLFSKNLKTSFHDGPITFSSDGKTAYFTRSQSINKKLSNNAGSENKLGVFQASFNGSEWVDIKPCSFNSDEYNVGQPSLSKDGKLLYVVSDKEGGFGGKDIYYSEFKEGSWSDLINLGKGINSNENEMFPFVDARGGVFYSSDKEGGYGGLDVYTAIKTEESWEGKHLQDTTINSSFDDFSIVWNKNQTEGYFTSNRNGSDDIFKITIVYPEFTACEELKEEQLCFEFFEEATLNADSVEMVYEWDFGDGTKEQQLEVYHCYKEPSLYIVELNIMDPTISKTFINEATYELEILPIIQPKVICPDSVFVEEEFKLEVQQGRWEAYTIENTYINFGDEQIVKAKQENHTYKTPGEKIIEILITGKNLETGKIETNCFYKTIKIVKKEDEKEKKELSLLEQQGFTIKEHLEDDSENLFYALEILTSSTSVKNDSSVLKEFVNQVQEQFNPSEQSYSYTLGQTQSPFDLIAKFRKAHQLGFDKAEVKQLEYKDNKLTVEDFGDIVIDNKGEVNITIKNIYFNFGSSDLKKQSFSELDKLIQFLKGSPSIKIEIGAYTDASRNVKKAKKLFKSKKLTYTAEAHDKMSSNYNLKLSQERATSVVNYLVQKGISKERLEGKGYGESNPLASNSTEEGRAKNRRVTFKIVSK